VSLPYPTGKDFELLHLQGRHIRFLWLVPITVQEERFRHSQGLDALESRFEQGSMNFLDPSRPSVV
jgi:hypothetical protein